MNRMWGISLELFHIQSSVYNLEKKMFVISKFLLTGPNVLSPKLSNERFLHFSH